MDALPLNTILAQDIVDTERDAMVVLATDLTIMSAHRAFYTEQRTSADVTLGNSRFRSDSD